MNNNDSIADEFAPTQFFLSQNYPNPFKEKTMIKYCVPLRTNVHIAIYNTEGKMLRVLVNEIKNPGTYETEINIANQPVTDESRLPDGYYFYKMIAEEFTSEKKWLCKNSTFGKLDVKAMFSKISIF